MTRPSTFSPCGTLPAKGGPKSGGGGWSQKGTRKFSDGDVENSSKRNGRRGRSGTSEKSLQRGRVTDLWMTGARQTSPEFAYLSHPPPYLKLMTRPSTFSACGTLPTKGGQKVGVGRARKELKNFRMQMWRILRNGTNEGAARWYFRKVSSKGVGN
ncbi:hypothetical protein CDAR_574111 [Caerostris darwini]|uniref:Uncharacterized protein n=1 Tax=Caerostris darwini TaxID=1538125 RepID=A0AAV4T928_9ARAC|nr:hypothetical protein CDAR_574111 [Caerostris darwini]